MKKTKLLTSLAALVLVLGLGACEESEIEEPDQETTSEEEVCEHVWGEWVETTPASCTETGLETRTCTLCGEVETRTIDALGHDYQAVVTAPTCTEKGYTTYTCSRCNDTYTDNETDALGHTAAEGYQSNGSYHWQVCATCEKVIPGSVEACSYEGLTYAYGYDGLHNVCDVCGELSVSTVETPSANSDGTYNFIANSNSSLTSALGALAEIESTSDGAQSTITLTEDLDLADGTDAAYEFSASNFILDGGEDGVTLEVSNQSKISGSNVTLTNITLDGSQVTAENYNATVQVTGGDVTFEGCTIVGCEGGTTYTSALYITSTETDCDVEVTDCEITGAFRGIYLNTTANVDVSVTDTYIDSIYSFNDTGASNSNFHFENSSLMGWTSYATSGDVTFTNCKLGFNDSTNQCYGFLRGYRNTTVFTNCFFESFVTRQAETENTLTNTYGPYLYTGNNNYMFGTGESSGTYAAVYVLIDCTFEQVANNGTVSIEALTAENINLLVSWDFDATVTGSGFKFSTCENAPLYTYSDLFPTEEPAG